MASPTLYISVCGRFVCRAHPSQHEGDVFSIDGAAHYRHEDRIKTWDDAKKPRKPYPFMIGGYSGRKKGFSLSLYQLKTDKPVVQWTRDVVVKQEEVIFRSTLAPKYAPWLVNGGEPAPITIPAPTRPRLFDQLQNGRVFELRSASTKYPTPCALVVDIDDKQYRGRPFRLVDETGVVGHSMYKRRHNPHMNPDYMDWEAVEGKLVRRREDLERFTEEDLALIRYGIAVDFDGRLHSYPDVDHPPDVVPATWTVFTVPAFTDGDDKDIPRYRFSKRYFSDKERLEPLLAGAWHFMDHGGPAVSGYKFGYVYGTRHSGKQLGRIRAMLKNMWPAVVETTVITTGKNRHV